MNRFHLREFETKSGQRRKYKFTPVNRKPKPKLPKIKDPHTEERPAVFSEESLGLCKTLATLNEKTDPRPLLSRVVNDSERVDSKGGGGAHIAYPNASGHISRECGVTVNGNVPVGEVVVMYAHNAPPPKDDVEEA